MKILLVEDEPSHAKLAQAVLASAGAEVTHVAAAEEAFTAFAAQAPDVILLDLKLPGLDGLSFARQLRRQAEGRRVPIVACTAYTNQFSAAAVKAAGCDDLLEKPLDTRTLAERIRRTAENAT